MLHCARSGLRGNASHFRANTTETSEVLISQYQSQGKIVHEPDDWLIMSLSKLVVPLQFGFLTKVHAAIRRMATCISIIIFALSTSGWANAT